MSSPLWLIHHSLRRARLLVLVMGAILALFQVVLVLFARSLQGTNSFDQLASLIPEFVRQLLGPSFVAVMSFRGVVCIGYFHVAVMGGLVGISIALATELAGEIESRFMDLLLARSMARHWVVTRSVVVCTACALWLLGMMVLGTWGGLRGLAPEGVEWPTPRVVGLLALNLGLLMLAWAGIALAVAAASRRRSVAGSLVGLAALVLFLLDYVGRIWQAAECVAWLSPFRYYSPLDLILGRDLPAGHLEVLALLAAAGFGLAYILFSRRDI
ncbi:MAG: hypothetical protein HYZ53_04585 [Planctomycetes bacterium]|nr:hypothetical protein [Planctomycetota bacterium]